MRDYLGDFFWAVLVTALMAAPFLVLALTLND